MQEHGGTEECRNEYFLEYRYRLAIAMEAESRRTRSEARRKAPVAEGEKQLSARGASSSLVPRSSHSLRLSFETTTSPCGMLIKH